MIKLQKRYYQSGVTYSIKYRKKMLETLKKAILAYEFKISEALFKDLGKSEYEIVTTEIGFALNEINVMLKNIDRWARKKRHHTNLLTTPSKAYSIREPYGVVLIISPWNYPFQLAITPLIGAIAGGNCSIIKPSEISENTAMVIKDMIDEFFDEQYIKVILGGIEETNLLLEEEFDKIFFTGSPNVGRIIMEKAAKKLIPVVLELGGKSPCIIDKTCQLEKTVKRIVFGKGVNAGQTCVAPDYLIVHEDIKDAFIKKFIETAHEFYGKNDNADLSRIINERHFKRIISYLEHGRILYGGNHRIEDKHIDLTLLEVDNLEKSVMKEEIFGPVLPMITFHNLEEVINIIQKNPNPLAFYVFSNDKNFSDTLIKKVPFGGGCVNDTIMHLTNEHLPFGGRGTSGMGNYHGKYSYQAFTHQKAILHSPNYFDLKLKYPPFKKNTVNILKKWMYR